MSARLFLLLLFRTCLCRTSEDPSSIKIDSTTLDPNMIKLTIFLSRIFNLRFSPFARNCAPTRLRSLRICSFTQRPYAPPRSTWSKVERSMRNVVRPLGNMVRAQTIHKTKPSTSLNHPWSAYLPTLGWFQRSLCIIILYSSSMDALGRFVAVRGVGAQASKQDRHTASRRALTP